MNVILTTDPADRLWSGGTVIYRVTVDGTWVGWIGDGRAWKGWRYGGRRWWACWRQDGDTAARWSSNLDYPTRTAARVALLARITTHNPG